MNRAGILVLSLFTTLTTASFAADARADIQRAHFAALEAAAPSRAPFTQITLKQSLEAMGALTGGFSEAGHGDVEYWMKSARNMGMSAQAMGRGLGLIATSMEPGPVAASVRGMGRQLESISFGGHGDVYYWMARTKSITQQVRAVGSQMATVADSLTDATPCPAAAAAVLQAVAGVVRSVDPAGRGDVEYWMKTTRDFVAIGRASGRAVVAAAAGLPAPLPAVLNGVATQLLSLSEGGHGTADYWMARTRGVADQMHGVAASLAAMAQDL